MEIIQSPVVSSALAYAYSKEALLLLDPSDDELIPLLVVTFYNSDIKHDKVMQLTTLKLCVCNLSVLPSEIYFVCFDAKLTPKHGKGTPEQTNCCSVLFKDVDSDLPEVFSIRLGSLFENDIQKWLKERLDNFVSYSMPGVEPAPPMEETRSDNQEDDVDTDSGDEDVDTDGADQNLLAPIKSQKCGRDRRTRQSTGCYSCSNMSLKDARVRKMAKEAVAYLNKERCARMKLVKIRGCFIGERFVREKHGSYGVPAIPYHLNFDTSLMEKDGTGTKTKQSWQAVLSNQSFGGIKMWLLKEGKETNKWCEHGHCVCEFPHWDEKDERKELLEHVCPEWYPDLDDGWEVVDA